MQESRYYWVKGCTQYVPRPRQSHDAYDAGFTQARAHAFHPKNTATIVNVEQAYLGLGWIAKGLISQGKKGNV